MAGPVPTTHRPLLSHFDIVDDDDGNASAHWSLLFRAGKASELGPHRA